MPRINSIYAFLSVDALDGNEGVVAAPLGELGLVPLIAADKARLQQLIPKAQLVADCFKMKIKLVKFTQREELQTIQPHEN